MPKTLEEIAAIAKSSLPKKAEPKDAAPAPSAETKKIEVEVKKAVEAEPKAEPKLSAEEIAKKDEEILSKKDEELDDAGKNRKAELTKVAEETKKSNVQKRIDELTGKIKELESDRNSTKQERDAIKAELDGIKKQLSMTPQDKAREKARQVLDAQKKKYLEEDKVKPREERREMDKFELDEWLLEDYEGASEWITKRTIRRHEEERDFYTNEEYSQKAEVILDKQQESQKRVFVKHPDLQVDSRQEQLRREGKSKEQILEILCKENPKYATCVSIYNENPQKYMLSEDGPELIVKEMERRMSQKPQSNDEVEKIRRELAEAKAEVERLKNLDSGITSTRHAEPKTPETEMEKKQFEFARKAGLDPERLKRRIAERQKMGYDS